MKFKALRKKFEPKEFVIIKQINGLNFLFTSDLPNPMPITATIDNLKLYYEKYSPLPIDINLDDFEIIEFDLIETNVICADIRNKLSSPKNLVSLLRTFFDETNCVKHIKLKKYIIIEMENTEKIIKYLSDLL